MTNRENEGTFIIADDAFDFNTPKQNIICCMKTVVTSIFDKIILEQNEDQRGHFKDEEWTDIVEIMFSKEKWETSDKDSNINYRTILNKNVTTH